LAVAARSCAFVPRRKRKELTTDTLNAAIIDIRLPDGNGADLIGALRTAARRIPMMVLTMIQDPELHGRWRDLGAVEVVSNVACVEDILAAARRLGRNPGRQREAMHEDQRVSDMVNRDLSRQESIRAKQTGSPAWARGHRKGNAAFRRQ
jgi:DNA-binding NarL/FixJ family response regulator